MNTPAGNTTKYIIFPSIEEGNNLINQINTCMGWPDNTTSTWMEQPDWMCEFDLNNGEKTSIGYGVIIKDQIMNCLTPQQQTEVFDIPSNINTCAWEPII
jgi:hypothetical protein